MKSEVERSLSTYLFESVALRNRSGLALETTSDIAVQVRQRK
jgi:hypothetical protein